MAGQKPSRGTTKIMAMIYTIHGGTNQNSFSAYAMIASLPPLTVQKNKSGAGDGRKRARKGGKIRPSLSAQIGGDTDDRAS